MRGFNSDLTTDHINSIALNTNRPQVDSSSPSPPPPQPPLAVVRYKECLKNHAANMGGHVTDGCGEFMPGGGEGTAEGLKCAACNCHRSFHRREAEGNSVPPSTTISSPHHPWGTLGRFAPLPQPLLPLPHQQGHTRVAAPPIMMTFGGGAVAESSSEDLNAIHANHGGIGGQNASKKRFRTKFTEDQKERMQDFAERIGWKIQKQNENEVQQFCTEVGIKRQVFKVWMHNCKQASKRRQL